MAQVLFHADSQDKKWLYVVPIAPQKRHIFEAQVKEDQENIDAPNASQEDKDVECEVNIDDEEVEEQSSNNSYDDKDIYLEIECENLIGIDLDIGLEAMRDIIEDEFDEESLPQINEE